MRRTMMSMASTLQVGQTLVGRTGIYYHLQKILYERKLKDNRNEEIIRRLWLAQYEVLNLQSVWMIELFFNRL
jgi:hypothetical protein